MDLSRTSALMQKYLEYYPSEPATDDDLRDVEKALGVVLPEDLKLISTVFAGGQQLGTFTIGLFASRTGKGDVIDLTMALRASIKLPERFVVLEEPAESLIVLETKGNSRIDTPVIWLADFDAERLVTGEQLLDADVFDCFTDFFAFLLESERDERIQASQ